MRHAIDFANDAADIIKEIDDIRDNICKKCNIDNNCQDARLIALNGIQKELIAFNMWTNCSNSLANLHTNNDFFDTEGFKQSVNSNLPLPETEIIMFDHLRLGLLSLIHFKIECLFNSLATALESTKKYSFIDLCKAILEETKNDNKRNIQILKTLTYMRNSLHNNGIHKNKNELTITINKMKFDYKTNKPIKCASWDHLLASLNANVDLLSKIVLSEKALTLNYVIPEQFTLAMKNDM